MVSLLSCVVDRPFGSITTFYYIPGHAGGNGYTGLRRRRRVRGDHNTRRIVGQRRGKRWRGHTCGLGIRPGGSYGTYSSGRHRQHRRIQGLSSGIRLDQGRPRGAGYRNHSGRRLRHSPDIHRADPSAHPYHDVPRLSGRARRRDGQSDRANDHQSCGRCGLGQSAGGGPGERRRHRPHRLWIGERYADVHHSGL